MCYILTYQNSKRHSVFYNLSIHAKYSIFVFHEEIIWKNHICQITVLVNTDKYSVVLIYMHSVADITTCFMNLYFHRKPWQASYQNLRPGLNVISARGL